MGKKEKKAETWPQRKVSPDSARDAASSPKKEVTITGRALSREKRPPRRQRLVNRGFIERSTEVERYSKREKNQSGEKGKA